ncbi:hypothetical protein BDV35DRAFT_337965 [Aspergillus flavus]|uniref:Uncharacterized protein n=1 Tax=Aspergillus flavus TaxID=5059 RepID=A0A5N6HFG4_ASPFL|nr:hypothetical protein BDV35DRAFT_337965 [Aspergillus flavus]
MMPWFYGMRRIVTAQVRHPTRQFFFFIIFSPSSFILFFSLIFTFPPRWQMQVDPSKKPSSEYLEICIEESPPVSKNGASSTHKLTSKHQQY